MENEMRNLVRLYEENQCLWDPSNENYYKKSYRSDAWRDIGSRMNKPVDLLKKKMSVLMGSYRREKSRIKRSLMTGSGKVYKSRWFGYEWFQFLTNKKSTETLVVYLQEEAMLYKMHPVIWDSKHKFKRHRRLINEAWTQIQNCMPEPCTIPQLKKKKESLMSAYRSYKTKIKNTTTANGEQTYEPTWFAFSLMDSFLSNVYLPNETQCSENDTSQQNTDSPEKIEIECEFKPVTSTQTNEPNTTKQNRNRPIKRPHSPDQSKYSRYDSFTAERPKKEEDECDVITKLWARKLKKLPEERREVLIYKINNLIYGENIAHHSNRELDYADEIVVPSPIQIYKSEGSPSEDLMSSDG